MSRLTTWIFQGIANNKPPMAIINSKESDSNMIRRKFLLIAKRMA